MKQPAVSKTGLGVRRWPPFCLLYLPRGLFLVRAAGCLTCVPQLVQKCASEASLAPHLVQNCVVIRLFLSVISVSLPYTFHYKGVRPSLRHSNERAYGSRWTRRCRVCNCTAKLVLTPHIAPNVQRVQNARSNPARNITSPMRRRIVAIFAETIRGSGIHDT